MLQHSKISNQTIEQRLKDLKELLSLNNNIRMIGICGIPGAGKSTITELIPQYINDAVVLSMDGYHIQRKYLNQEGIRRRGAPFTFDMNGFKTKIQEIKFKGLSEDIGFPTFDHKQKDPIHDAIRIPAGSKHIFIEGIYTFDKNLQLDNFWDLMIWIQADKQIAIDRMAKRHLQAKIVDTLPLAYERIQNSDKLNMQYILQNCYSTASQYFVINNN